MAQQVEQSARIIDHPRIAEFVSRVGQSLVRNSDSKVPFTIKLIEGEEINALSLPGGYFYVNTGLILAASTEAEMAGAMAHEIAHIAARHGTRQASRSEIAQLATIPLIFMGGGWIGYGARQAAGVIVPTTFLAFLPRFRKRSRSAGHPVSI
jgi:predicted Zn-dependent protease